MGSIGTARQLEYETDALPVGGGGMFTENALALLALVAVSIAGGAGAGAFAGGVGKLLGLVTFGGIQQAYGTALGFGVFVVIVLTMVQLVFRVMRVTLGEWLGDVWLGFKNPHISAIISMGLTMLLVLSGTWIYLWQLFGASNQLMAALSLLIVSLWLKSVGRSPRFAFWPMLFMYITTMAAIIVTAYNLYASILSNSTDRLADHQHAGRSGDDRGCGLAVCGGADYRVRRLACLGPVKRAGAGAADGGGLD